MVSNSCTGHWVITQRLVTPKPTYPLRQIAGEIFCQGWGKARSTNMDGTGSQPPSVFVDLGFDQAMQEEDRFHIYRVPCQVFYCIIGLRMVGHFVVFAERMTSDGHAVLKH